MDCPTAGCRPARAFARLSPPPSQGRWRQSLRRGAFALGLLLAATGCAGVSGGGLGRTVDRTLAAVGLRDAQAVADRQRTVALELHGANNLNAGRGRKGVAVVVRVYQLRDTQRFGQLPMARFLEPRGEHEALGDELVEVGERILLPGETLAWPVRLEADTRHLGVVAMFRQPGDGPWRFVFERHKALQDGVVLGLHACALTTASAALATPMSGDPMSLSGVRCGG